MTEYTANDGLYRHETEHCFGLMMEVGHGRFIAAGTLGNGHLFSHDANCKVPATRHKIASDEPVLLTVREQARARGGHARLTPTRLARRVEARAERTSKDAQDQ